MFENYDFLLKWKERNGVAILRVSLGIVFLWFGILKFFPGISPAEIIAERTINKLSFGILPATFSMPILAVWECTIGLGLILNVWLRLTLILLYVQMAGTFLPLLLFPNETFKGSLFVPTLLGQYIIKNCVLISGGIVIGGYKFEQSTVNNEIVEKVFKKSGALDIITLNRIFNLIKNRQMLKLNPKPVKILMGITGAVIILLATVFYSHHKIVSKPAIPVIVRQPLDEASANQVLSLDRQNQHATFVFVNEVPGIAAMHNRVITLPPIGDELRIDFDQYLHKGHNGPLYIILPDSYAGPKEKFVMKAFPDYKGWYGSMLSDKFVMYAAK